MRRPSAARLAPRDEGVSAVVGSILILALTVVGMAAVMIWGAPALQEAQERASQDAMEETLKDLRHRTLALGIPDAAQVPVVRLGSGGLATADGDWLMVAATHDASNPDCSFRLTQWSDGDAVLDVDLTDCRGATTGGGCTVCLVTERVAGSLPITTNASLSGSTLTVEMALSGSDWQFSIVEAGTTYAQAWLIRTGDIAWTGDGRSSHLAGGGVYSWHGDDVFLLQSPPVQEDAFGTGDYVLRLPTTRGDDAISGTTDVQMYLGLAGIHARINDATYTLRYQASGDLAEAWCNAWLLRNQLVSGNPYVAEAACTSAEPSVRYQLVSPPSSDPGNAVFELEVLHLDITTSILQ